MKPCLVPLLLLASIAFAAPAPAAESPVDVRLKLAAQPRTLPADYLGLSFETERILPDADGTYYFRSDNSPLLNLFRTLNIRSLRVGGNTADRATVRIPGEKDIDALFAFAKAADVKVIYTLRLKSGDPADSARVARYIFEHYQDRLTGFAIGNEPNVFTSDYQVFLAQWKAHAQAVRAVAPGARFCGPAATAGKAAWARDFATEFAASGQIAAITYHLYPGGNSGLVADPARGREQMLSPEWLAQYQKMADGFVPTVLEKKLPYRLEECNSFWNGGAKDVSDTHAAALWGLDYLWWWASHGAAGMNFHTGDTVAREAVNTPCNYALFWTRGTGYEAHPLAYAFKLFDQGFGQGAGTLMTAEVAQNPDHVNLTAYAVELPDKSRLLTIIDKEISAAARDVVVTLPPGAVSVMRLESRDHSAAETASTTCGRGAIAIDGTWSGGWEMLPPGASTLIVPHASAVLVKLSKP